MDVLRLAVADDDPDYRLLVGLALEDAPDLAVVAEAADGAALASCLETVDVDLVLCDRALPGVLDAVAALRRSRSMPRLVLTSSLPPPRLGADLAATGAVGSLSKDVPLRQLASAVRSLGALVAAAERTLRAAHQALPRALESVPTSRQVTRDVLAGWCDAEVADTAVLLMSELVTNGVRHAATEVDIRVAVGTDHIRVEVTDRNPDLPVARHPAPTEPGGRGIGLVSQLAARWGVQPARTGKVVWFELPRTTLVAGS